MQWTAIRTADKVYLFGLHEGDDCHAHVHAQRYLNRPVPVDHSECFELTEEEADLLPDGKLRSMGGGNVVRVIDRDDSAPWARVFTAADKTCSLWSSMWLVHTVAGGAIRTVKVRCENDLFPGEHGPVQAHLLGGHVVEQGVDRLVLVFAPNKEAALRIGLLTLGKKSPEVEGREVVLSAQNRNFREEFEALGSALCCSRERVLERAQECREAELQTMGLKQQMALMQDAIDAMTSEQERLKRTVATLAQTAVDIAIDRRMPSELKISDVE